MLSLSECRWYFSINNFAFRCPVQTAHHPAIEPDHHESCSLPDAIQPFSGKVQLFSADPGNQTYEYQYLQSEKKNHFACLSICSFVFDYSAQFSITMSTSSKILIVGCPKSGKHALINGICQTNDSPASIHDLLITIFLNHRTEPSEPVPHW